MLPLPSKLLSLAFSLLAASLAAASAATLPGTLPVTSNLQFWLSADAINPADLTQVNLVNGSYYVKDWQDQSPNHGHATQTVAARQPWFVPNAQNGLPLVRFDGVANLLTTTQPQVAGDKSIFVVQRRISLPVPSGTELSSTSGKGFFMGNTGGAEGVGRIGVAFDLQSPGNLNSTVLKSFVRQGSTETLMVNDVAVSTTVVDSVGGNYSLSDPTYLYSGAIGELLIYNRAVSEAERQSIENYLCEKWALWTVPVPVQNGLQVWLSGDAINLHDPAQVVQRNGNTFLSKWVGGSVLGRNAYQANAANQPQVLPGGYISRNTIRFNGKTSFMTTAAPQIAGDKSIYLVQSRASSANIGTEISSSTSTTGFFLSNNTGWPVSSTGPFTEGKGRLGKAFDEQVPLLLNQFVLKSFLRSGSSETITLNGVSSTAASIPDAASGYFSISDPSYPFAGDIGEILIYNRALSSTESASVQAYLGNKWSYTADNLYSVTSDVTVPAMTTGSPAAGVRVKQTSPEYAGTGVYHTLYLPTDWQPGTGKTYPVIVEYAPNGGFTDSYGDVTSGNVEDCNMGYGITAGKGYIWICMPIVGGSPLVNQTNWWGDVAATEDYCLKTILHVCQDYGGDPSAIICAGFSRGSLACNYIGLNDDNIADTWLAFIPHAHYDGQYSWGQPNDDPASALVRLLRLKGRWQHLSHEIPIVGPLAYLQSTGVDLTPFTIRTLPYQNHSDGWTTRPIQLRRDVRAWLAQVVATRPGTHAIRGVVKNAGGQRLGNVLIQSGTTHFTFTDATGAYTLAGLIDSNRTVTATADFYAFSPLSVTVSGADVANVNFTGQSP